MPRTGRVVIVLALIVGAIALAGIPGSAHKPITSPYTYNEDVYPVLRDRCSRCHVPGGVAPMSLMTYEDTVPWGESIRVELLAGHMPPWGVDSAPGRFHNLQPLTAREMNVLLTWATGGTPLGDPRKTPMPAAPRPEWALGPPDLELPFPTELTLGDSAHEGSFDVIVPTGTSERRFVRAVDLLPGTPAIVRAATVQVKTQTNSPPDRTVGDERVLALWLPGDDPVVLDSGTGFELPAGAELLVRVHYKKTWQYERKEMRDRSTIGLYFAPGPTAPVRTVTLAPEASANSPSSPRLTFSRTLDEQVRALGIYPQEHPANVGVSVTAIGVDGSRTQLIAFHPRVGWARRYWFREPIALAPGTRLETTVTFDDEAPLLPLSAAPSQAPTDQSAIRLTLNVVAAR